MMTPFDFGRFEATVEFVEESHSFHLAFQESQVLRKAVLLKLRHVARAVARKRNE